MVKARDLAIQDWLAPLSSKELSLPGVFAQRLLEGRAVNAVDNHTRSVSQR